MTRQEWAAVGVLATLAVGWRGVILWRVMRLPHAYCRCGRKTGVSDVIAEYDPDMEIWSTEMTRTCRRGHETVDAHHDFAEETNEY